MFNTPRREESRAANGGLLTGLFAFALLGALVRLPASPMWMAPALSACGITSSACPYGGPTSAVATATPAHGMPRGPVLAPLSPSQSGATPPGLAYSLAGANGAAGSNFAGYPDGTTIPVPRTPLPTPAHAWSPKASRGMDISQYQCGDIPVARAQIAVVQVSGGSLSGQANRCYAAQAQWAGRGIQAYIYLNGVPTPTAASDTTGSGRSCAGNSRCTAYAFGWNWTQHWVAYSRSSRTHPGKWWLDVEKDSGWSDTGTNSAVILGALDALRSDGISAGIYSSASQWNAITGGLQVPGVDLWVPGAGNLTGPGYSATGMCADASQVFAGGHVRYVQYGYTGNFPGAYSGPSSPYDLDYAC